MSALLGTKREQPQLLRTAKATFPRITPRCQYVGTCGGCNLQDLAYEHQLALKQRGLAQVFGPFGVNAVPLVPLEEPWRYRNKLELSFGRSAETPVLGLHAAGSFWKVVDIEDCWLVPEPFARVAATVRETARRSGLPTYDAKRHHGFWRHAILRYSRATQQLLVCIITSAGPRQPLDDLAAALARAHPDVATLYWGVNDRLADVASSEALTLIAGPPYLRERIGPFIADLHPLNFLQPSLTQAERLYETLAGWVQARAVAQAWDLYAGIGCIGLYLSRVASSVVCLESEAPNVELLRHNAQLNAVTNLTAHQGQVESSLRYLEGLPAPDCIVVDPPRAGLHKYALRTLVSVQPRCFVYVSCNLATLAPNLRALLAHWPAYRIAAVHAFDLFPQTTHVETLVLLERS